MSTPTYTVSVDDTLVHAHQLMQEHSVSCLAVVEGDAQLVGVITRSDLLHIGTVKERDRWSRALILPATQVRTAMTADVLALPIDATVVEAAQAMVDNKVHRVFVTARGDVTGVFSTLDVMRALADLGDDRPLSEFMSRPVLTIGAYEHLGTATRVLERSGVHGLVVVERGQPIGVFADIDALEARHWPEEQEVDQVMNSRILALPHTTPLRRAAEQAAATRVRRVLAMDNGELVGILTGIDFARALTESDA